MITTTTNFYVDESTSILAMWWTFVGMSRQKAHIPLCSMLNVRAVQSKCKCQRCHPLGGTEELLGHTHCRWG